MSLRNWIERTTGKSFESYIASMRQPKTWGEEVTLLAICEAFQAAVVLVSSVEGGAFTRTHLPKGKTAKDALPQLWLGHESERHYWSLQNSAFEVGRDTNEWKADNPNLSHREKTNMLLATIIMHDGVQKQIHVSFDDTESVLLKKAFPTRFRSERYALCWSKNGRLLRFKNVSREKVAREKQTLLQVINEAELDSLWVRQDLLDVCSKGGIVLKNVEEIESLESIFKNSELLDGTGLNNAEKQWLLDESRKVMMAKFDAYCQVWHNGKVLPIFVHDPKPTFQQILDGVCTALCFSEEERAYVQLEAECKPGKELSCVGKFFKVFYQFYEQSEDVTFVLRIIVRGKGPERLHASITHCLTEYQKNLHERSGRLLYELQVLEGSLKESKHILSLESVKEVKKGILVALVASFEGFIHSVVDAANKALIDHFSVQRTSILCLQQSLYWKVLQKRMEKSPASFPTRNFFERSDFEVLNFTGVFKEAQPVSSDIITKTNLAFELKMDVFRTERFEFYGPVDNTYVVLQEIPLRWLKHLSAYHGHQSVGLELSQLQQRLQNSTGADLIAHVDSCLFQSECKVILIVGGASWKDKGNLFCVSLSELLGKSFQECTLFGDEKNLQGLKSIGSFDNSGDTPKNDFHGHPDAKILIRRARAFEYNKLVRNMGEFKTYDFMKMLSSFFYGIRCTLVHGSNERTLAEGGALGFVVMQDTSPNVAFPSDYFGDNLHNLFTSELKNVQTENYVPDFALLHNCRRFYIGFADAFCSKLEEDLTARFLLPAEPLEFAAIDLEIARICGIERLGQNGFIVTLENAGCEKGHAHIAHDSLGLLKHGSYVVCVWNLKRWSSGNNNFHCWIVSLEQAHGDVVPWIIDSQRGSIHLQGFAVTATSKIPCSSKAALQALSAIKYVGHKATFSVKDNYVELVAEDEKRGTRCLESSPFVAAGNFGTVQKITFTVGSLIMVQAEILFQPIDRTDCFKICLPLWARNDPTFVEKKLVVILRSDIALPLTL